MSKRSRNKGHSFERKMADRLRCVYPKVRRQLEYHEDDCRGVDLQYTDPFKIQCKKLKKYSPLSAIEEVQCDRFIGEIPVLITAGDHKEPIACLYLDDFIRLIQGKHA